MKIIKRFLKKIIILLTRKPIKVKNINDNALFDTKGFLKTFLIGNNITIKLESNNKIYYFRESYRFAKKISFKEYILQKTNYYFSEIESSKKAELYLNAIANDLNNKNNIKRMHLISQVIKDNFDIIIEKAFTNFELIGLPSLVTCSFSNESFSTSFCQFLSSQVVQFDLNKKEIGTLFSTSLCRQLATFKLSKLLGLEVIPFTTFCSLDNMGNRIYGTLQDDAGSGVSPAFLKTSYRKRITSGFIKELTNLEYFDAICYQLDHRIDNYNIKYDNEGNICGVSAFDNDELHTFSLNCHVPKITYSRSESVIKNGVLNRKYIDKEFYDALTKLSFKRVFLELKDVLTIFQINSLISRIKQLKRAISKTVRETNGLCFALDMGKIDFENTIGYLHSYFTDTSLLDRIEKKGR